MASIQNTVGIAGDSQSSGGGGGVCMSVDPTFGAGRFSLRGYDYQSLGSYRLCLPSTTSGTLGAGTSGIVYSLIYGPNVTTQAALVTRLSVNYENLTAITTATPVDLLAYIGRGATGKASGTGSVTATLTGNNNKLRTAMATCGWGAGTNGEMRANGGSATTLTAAAGFTIDSQAIGSAMFGQLFNSSSTGTAVKVSPGAATTPGGPIDFFCMQPGSNHPITLVPNEGFQIQTVTAGPASGTAEYYLTIEWTEVIPLLSGTGAY